MRTNPFVCQSRPKEPELTPLRGWFLFALVAVAIFAGIVRDDFLGLWSNWKMDVTFFYCVVTALSKMQKEWNRINGH